jgi:hypothetical protein
LKGRQAEILTTDFTRGAPAAAALERFGAPRERASAAAADKHGFNRSERGKLIGLNKLTRLNE